VFLGARLVFASPLPLWARGPVQPPDLINNSQRSQISRRVTTFGEKKRGLGNSGNLYARRGGANGENFWPRTLGAFWADWGPRASYAGTRLLFREVVVQPNSVIKNEISKPPRSTLCISWRVCIAEQLCDLALAGKLLFRFVQRNILRPLEREVKLFGYLVLPSPAPPPLCVVTLEPLSLCLQPAVTSQQPCPLWNVSLLRKLGDLRG
jgi:hypothetical protein